MFHAEYFALSIGRWQAVGKPARTDGAAPGPSPRRRPVLVRPFFLCRYLLVTVIGVRTTGVARMIGEDSRAVRVCVPGNLAVAR